MRKLVYLALSVFVVLTFFTVNGSEAKDSYGNDVNSFCIDSNPYSGDCLFCHTANSKSDRTSETDAYLSGVRSGDLCYFCPNDSTCSGPACTDADNDGFYAEDGCGTLIDCNDNDSAINPDAFEICDDSKDNDCNGDIDWQDSACGVIVCTDSDGDGYSTEGADCGPADCNDNDDFIYPGAEDICSDGIDQDCSGKDRTKGKGCKKLTTGREGKGRTCSDGIDNDGDGLWDCQDADCSGNRACKIR